MTNPAQELAALLSGWHVSNGNTPVTARGGEHQGDLPFWQKQAHAVNLVQEIERAIAALDAQNRNVEEFRAAVPAWYRAVFSYSIPWGNGLNGSSAAIDSAALSMLSGFGLVLDLMGDSPALSSTQREELRVSLAQAQELLDEELSAVPNTERAYVMTLVDALTTALSFDGPLDAEALKATIDQLNGALIAIAAQLSVVGEADKAQVFMDVVKKIVSATRGAVYDAAALAGIVAAVPIVQQALTK
ncbi:hypothetical protein [Leifsonia virtsii]|uniref:Uncharacterized protein n=1 Tax=Leifsonia virtsii TaxID=3035915 RepID=A0ABT8J5A4_9MICO|nr:hypothetical protein [Leifsonia virtsii]MDN4599444.1 hypothetical protein [Leifsonia virtsii]